MTKFQIIGIVALVFILYSYFRRFRKPAMDKIFMLLIAVTGIFFLLSPDSSSRLAHYLGIGRGADLIFYLAILGFGYLAVVLYAKIIKLEEQITLLVRKQSLETVQTGKNESRSIPGTNNS